MSLHGHAWTFGPFLRHNLRPPAMPRSVSWSGSVSDPELGSIRLTGELVKAHADGNGTRAMVVIIHGLGGSQDSYYAKLTAAAAARMGLGSLRLNLRGADRRGEDFYHAGLIADLAAVLSDDAVAGHDAIHAIGFSLGGHMLLRYLGETENVPLRSAATICSPVHLASGAQEIDRPRGRFYRRHVLTGLKEIYREVAQRRDVPTPVADAERIDTIREWDERVIAPRHGFAGAEDYWAKMSACHSLARIEVPTLVVAAEHDPMVPIHTVRPWLEDAPIRSVVTSRGGHVGFPASVDLGLGHDGSVYEQVLRWLVDVG